MLRKGLKQYGKKGADNAADKNGSQGKAGGTKPAEDAADKFAAWRKPKSTLFCDDDEDGESDLGSDIKLKAPSRRLPLLELSPAAAADSPPLQSWIKKSDDPFDALFDNVKKPTLGKKEAAKCAASSLPPSSGLSYSSSSNTGTPSINEPARQPLLFADLSSARSPLTVPETRSDGVSRSSKPPTGRLVAKTKKPVARRPRITSQSEVNNLAADVEGLQITSGSVANKENDSVLHSSLWVKRANSSVLIRLVNPSTGSVSSTRNLLKSQSQASLGAGTGPSLSKKDRLPLASFSTTVISPIAGVRAGVAGPQSSLCKTPNSTVGDGRRNPGKGKMLARREPCLTSTPLLLSDKSLRQSSQTDIDDVFFNENSNDAPENNSNDQLLTGNELIQQVRRNIKANRQKSVKKTTTSPQAESTSAEKESQASAGSTDGLEGANEPNESLEVIAATPPPQEKVSMHGWVNRRRAKKGMNSIAARLFKEHGLATVTHLSARSLRSSQDHPSLGDLKEESLPEEDLHSEKDDVITPPERRALNPGETESPEAAESRADDVSQRQQPTPTSPEDMIAYEDLNIHCVCKTADPFLDSTLLLVRCTNCQRCLHPECLGLTEEEMNSLASEEFNWICPFCVSYDADKSRSNSGTSTKSGSGKVNEVLHSSLTEPTPRDERDRSSSKNMSGSEVRSQSSSSSSAPEEAVPDDPAEDEFEDIAESEFGMAVQRGKKWRRSLLQNLAANSELQGRASLDPGRLGGDRASVGGLGLGRSNNRYTMFVRRQTALLCQALAEEEEENEEAETEAEAEAEAEAPQQGNEKTRPSHNTTAAAKKPSLLGATNMTNPKSANVTAALNNSVLLQPELTDLEKLLVHCSERKIVQFSSHYPDEFLLDSKKVGEGAFGEVYLLGVSGEEKPVLKVVPVGGTIKVNDEDQTGLKEMLSEVVISSTLSNLRSNKFSNTTGFVEVRNCVLFQGEYPPALLSLWDKYDQEKTSENYRPDYLPDDQLYVALEFNNGGQDLEKFVFKNATQALAAWKQVAHTVAVAEEACEFEHRDLHWGNVLVKETDKSTVDFCLAGDRYTVETCGVEITIIDFSLSRLTSQDEDCTVYSDLAKDPTLFTAMGVDKGGDYQFDIYRMMKKENKNNWQNFNPKTNVFWLHYLLDKMTKDTEVYYKGKKTAKAHKSGMAIMRNMKANLLKDFGSARDYVLKHGTLNDA